MKVDSSGKEPIPSKVTCFVVPEIRRLPVILKVKSVAPSGGVEKSAIAVGVKMMYSFALSSVLRMARRVVLSRCDESVVKPRALILIALILASVRSLWSTSKKPPMKLFVATTVLGSPRNSS